MPSSCSEITSDRRASRALPPALRIMWASPRGMPYAEAGSMRASMHVTVDKAVELETRVKNYCQNKAKSTYQRHISLQAAGRGRLP